MLLTNCKHGLLVLLIQADSAVKMVYLSRYKPSMLRHYGRWHKLSACCR